MTGDYGVTAEEREKDGLWRRMAGMEYTSCVYRGEILAYQTLGLAALSGNEIDIVDWRYPDDPPITTVQCGDDDVSAAARYLEQEVFARLDDPDEATYRLGIRRKEGADPRYRISVTLPDEATWRDPRADTRLPDFVLYPRIPLDEGETVEELLSRYNIPIKEGQSK